MPVTGTRTRRRLLMAEQASTFPPMVVLASWIHALLTHLLVLMYLYAASGFRMSRKQVARILLCREALPGITVCHLGTIVSLCFLILLYCEFRRTPPEIRSRIGVRVAYLAAILLVLSCIALWDGTTWFLSVIAG